jgi:hypothetical protein
LVLRDAQAGDRAALVRDLVAAGFEVRPILIGNFAKNEVMKYCDYTIHSTLKNADYIDAHGRLWAITSAISQPRWMRWSRCNPTCRDSTMHDRGQH